MKLWNVDHYDHYQTIRDSDGNEVQAIIKCEMEKNTMNSYITTQGTVKVVNPETNGQVRPQSNAYVVYKGEKVYVEVESYYKLNNRSYATVKALQGKPFNMSDAETMGNGEFRRERTAFIYTESPQLLTVTTPDAPHAVEEAYQMDVEALLDYMDEGCGNDTADLLAGMR